MRRWMSVLAFLLIAVMSALPGVAIAADAPDPGEALRDAALKGDLAAVRAQIDAGVLAGAPAPRHGQTAILFAAQGGHTEIVRLLLDRGADANALETFFRQTPLLVALAGKHIETAKLLLANGAKQAAEALATAIELGDAALARAALATGRVRALELKAARKLAMNSTVKEIPEMLAAAVPPAVGGAPLRVGPDALLRYAGRYRPQDGPEIRVDVRNDARGGALAVTTTGIPEIMLWPRGDDYFETEAGDLSMQFSGRAGTIERAALNRDGDVASFSLVTSDPTPLPTAEALPNEVAPPRTASLPWPGFRGEGGSGIADGQGVPLRWDVSKGEGIRFKTPIPGIALSSPVVWGDRIFITTAVSAKGDRTFRTGLYGDGTSVDDVSEHVFRLIALDAKTGAILWDREVHRAVPTVRRHLKSSLANATPVTDGRRVVVLFGAVGVLASYSLNGNAFWRRDVGILDCNDPQAGVAEWGHASSPVLHDGLVIVQGDRRKDSFVAAWRADDGEPVWRVARDETSTWATPAILKTSSGAELVTNGRTIRGYDPRTGATLWTLSPNSEVVVATPVIGEGKAFLTAGYPPIRPIYAVLGGQRGDLTLPEGRAASAAIAWSHAKGGTYIPTPILYRGHLYLINNNGLLACYRSDTGELVYQTRLGGAGVSFSASPIAADGRLYFASEAGEVYVVRAGPSHELLATNTMDETVMATPAAGNGLLLIRTLGHVVGIGVGTGVGS